MIKDFLTAEPPPKEKYGILDGDGLCHTLYESCRDGPVGVDRPI